MFKFWGGARGALLFCTLICFTLVSTVSAAPDESEPVNQEPVLVIGFSANDSGYTITKNSAKQLTDFMAEKIEQRIKGRVFDTSDQLMRWLTEFREVDVAIVSGVSGAEISAKGLSVLAQEKAQPSVGNTKALAVRDTLRELQDKVAEALLIMDQSPAGQNALKAISVNSFDRPPTPKKILTKTFTATGAVKVKQSHRESQPEKPRTAIVAKPTKKPVPVIHKAEQTPVATRTERRGAPPVSEPKVVTAAKDDGPQPLVVGFTTDNKGSRGEKAGAEALRKQMEKDLSVPVKTRSFSSAESLYSWLANFREVDIALFNVDFLKQKPVGQVALVVNAQELTGKEGEEKVVAHLGVEKPILEQVRNSLTSLEEHSHGKEALKELNISRFVKPTVVKTAKIADDQKQAIPPQRKPVVVDQASPVRTKKVESKREENPFTVKPSSAWPAPAPQPTKQKPLVLGIAANDKSAVETKKNAEAASGLLQDVLSTPVKARSFADEKSLYRWLQNFREVDIALFSDEFIKTLPVGELTQLAQAESATKAAMSGKVVVHQGFSPELREKIHRALLSLDENLKGQELLAKLGFSQFSAIPKPKTTAAPTEQKAPVVVVKPAQAQEQAAPVEQAKTTVGIVEETLQKAVVSEPAVKVENVPPVATPKEQPLAVAPVIAKTEIEEAVARVDSPVVSEPEKGMEEPPQVPVAPEEPMDRKVTTQASTHSLSDLFGTDEVSVKTSVGDHYVENMANVQLLGEDLTHRVSDTDLSESIKAGRTFSRDSLAAQKRTEQATAQTGQAFGLLLPQVTVRVAYGSETSEPGVEIDEVSGELIESDTHERTDTSLSVRQTLFDLPRYFDWKRRQVTELARKENQRISDGDAYLATVDSYLSLVSSRLQADVTRGFEDQLAELLDYIEKRVSAGAASVSDMARVRARIQATLSSRLEQEAAHATAGIEFVRLTNVAPGTVRMPEPEDIGEALLPGTFDGAVEAAMSSNPEIQALASELEAAKIDMKAAKSRYLPRLDAEYTDTYSLGAGGSNDKNGQRDMRLMAVLNWELFSGGKDRQYNVERVARHKELQYRLDDQRRRVVETLSANYTALETTRERLESSYKELESISTAADAMSKRMLSGKQSLLDLLDVYDRYYQVRSRLVNLHILEMNTISQLIRLTHGAPWDETVQAMWTDNEDS